MKFAVVGGGYWGKNLIRCLNNLKMLQVVYDVNESTLASYKDIETGTDYTTCLQREDIDGVVIATPPVTHFDIASKCLEAGKHVFLEKPMTLSPDTSQRLVELAKQNKRVLMVGHIFLYSPEIIKLKEIVNSPEFGEIKYAYTQRLNLGKIQQCGVVLDLAPHDISILDYLFDDVCSEVKVVAKSHILPNIEDVAFISLKYTKGVLAHLHLSWLDPRKIRDTVVVGTKQMVVCDSITKRIDIYNNSVDLKQLDSMGNESYTDHLLSYTYGDIVSPFINASKEPMTTELVEFSRCIAEHDTPLASGELGLSVVKTITAVKEAMEQDGWVKI